MDVKIIKGDNIDLSTYYHSSDIAIYKYFNILKSSMFHALIIENDSDLELFNLTIYKQSDHDTVISYLIKNKFFNLNFDINHIDSYTSVINSLIDNSYNMPYIYENDEENDEKNIYPFTVISIIYNPDLKKIKFAYIKYILEEYYKQEKIICEAWATFNKHTLHKIYSKILSDKNEISGKLHIHQTIDEINKIVFEISHEKTIHNGDDKEVDSVESSFNFHTHPLEAYHTANTQLGWPSVDDYVIFIMAFLYDNNPTYFHWVCTLEGIYVLTIPRETIKILNILKDNKPTNIEKEIEDYLYKHININKNGFRKDKGIVKNNIVVNSPKSYIEFINNATPFSHNKQSIKLFDINFFDWKGPLGILENNRMYFTFYYPKIKGNCIPNQEFNPNISN